MPIPTHPHVSTKENFVASHHMLGLLSKSRVCRVSNEVIWLMERKCLESLFPTEQHNEGKALEEKCSVDGRGASWIKEALKMLCM